MILILAVFLFFFYRLVSKLLLMLVLLIDLIVIAYVCKQFQRKIPGFDWFNLLDIPKLIDTKFENRRGNHERVQNAQNINKIDIIRSMSTWGKVIEERRTWCSEFVFCTKRDVNGLDVCQKKLIIVSMVWSHQIIKSAVTLIEVISMMSRL